jgi:hypothetical protein
VVLVARSESVFMRALSVVFLLLGLGCLGFAARVAAEVFAHVTRARLSVLETAIAVAISLGVVGVSAAVGFALLLARPRLERVTCSLRGLEVARTSLLGRVRRVERFAVRDTRVEPPEPGARDVEDDEAPWWTLVLTLDLEPAQTRHFQAGRSEEEARSEEARVRAALGLPTR